MQTTSDHAKAIPGYRVIVKRWDHSGSGTRITRITYAAAVLRDGVVPVKCGHYMHPNSVSAENCGWKMARKIERQARRA